MSCSALMQNNLFDFILLFSANEVRWRFRKVGSMCFGFLVRGKIRGMENIVYFPDGG